MFKFFKRHLKFAILAPLFMICEVILDLLQPQVMAVIVDEGVLGLNSGGIGSMNIIIHAGLKMILLALAGCVCGNASGLFANLCSQNFGNDVRKACFAKVINFSFEQTDDFSTGSLVTRITNDVSQMENMVTHSLRSFVRSGMLLVGGIFFIVRLNISFGILTACMLPLVTATILFFIFKSNPIFNTLQSKLDRLNTVMQENVVGSRVVKAFVQEDREISRFEKANDDLVSTQLNALMLFSYMIPIASTLMNAVTLGIIYLGGLQVQMGNLTPGKIMAAITYISRIQHSLLELANVFQTISRGNASKKRLQEILDTDSIIRGGKKSGPQTVRGKVEFRNVSFSFSDEADKPVLHDINLVIEPGMTLGIMGATGCGKTSLVNLIPRFFDASKGEVLVDDLNVKEYDLTDLRDKVSIALQRSELYKGTIKENILWGKPNSTDAEVRRAAEIAQAVEFIDRKPEGLDTPVTERGTSLSGGQKQRIAISRAILKPAEILILDDATSALDLKTEANFYDALNDAYPGLTRIIVAQRIASVINTDRIAVLDGGTIAAIGNHEELLENSPIYRDIYNSQLKGKEA